MQPRIQPSDNNKNPKQHLQDSAGVLGVFIARPLLLNMGRGIYMQRLINISLVSEIWREWKHDSMPVNAACRRSVHRQVNRSISRASQHLLRFTLQKCLNLILISHIKITLKPQSPVQQPCMISFPQKRSKSAESSIFVPLFTASHMF